MCTYCTVCYIRDTTCQLCCLSIEAPNSEVKNKTLFGFFQSVTQPKREEKYISITFFFDKYAERDPTISEVMSYTKYTFKRNHFETRALRSICTATAVRVIGVVICRHTFCLCIQRDWNKACQSSLLEKMYIQTSFDVTPQENGRSVVLLPVVVAAYNDGERLYLIDPRDGKDPDSGPELTFTSGS